MDELNHVQGFRSEVPYSTAGELPSARNRLTDEARGGRGGAGLLSRLPRPSLGVGRVATASTLSVVLAGGLMASQTVDIGGDAPGGGAAPAGDGPAAVANADVLLDRAAEAAREDGLPSGQPGDFAYLETKLTVHHTSRAEPSWRHEKRWLSVDDSQPSRIRHRTLVGDPPETLPAERKFREWRSQAREWSTTDISPGQLQGRNLLSPTYAYLDSFPEDPDKLAAKIRQQHSSLPESQRKGEFGIIAGILGEQVVPPEMEATMFEVAKRLDGVEVAEQVTIPATGERGVAVTYTTHGVRTALVFDPDTYDFLGTRSTAVEDQQREGGSVQAGTVLVSAAIIEEGIVDEVGQQP